MINMTPCIYLQHMGDSAEENARLEVCLALVNKFQAPEDDMTDLNKLFIKTKELCVAIIPFLNGIYILVLHFKR